MLPLDGEVGGSWVPWWGPCVAGRLHKGTGLLGVGTAENKHSLLRRYLIILLSPTNPGIRDTL